MDTEIGLYGRENTANICLKRNLKYTQCGYEVPRMILMHDLKGAMRLDRSKDMSVHVSTCTSYDFNALTPVVCKLSR
jgi:hypothetical protein